MHLHTYQSVAKQLSQGLRSGTIVLPKEVNATATQRKNPEHPSKHTNLVQLLIRAAALPAVLARFIVFLTHAVSRLMK